MSTANQRLVVYVPPAEIAQLEAIAAQQGGRSLTSIVREFITAGLKSNGSDATSPEASARAATKGV